jgi:hypothetical protein
MAFIIPCTKARYKLVLLVESSSKFWETMVDEWIELESTPKKTTKKPNGSKKTKAKQNKVDVVYDLLKLLV